MGNLFDELKKSKLIDKKRAKQLAHEQRVERKQSGGDVAKDEDLARKAKDYESKKAEEKHRHRELERERQAEAKQRERASEIRQLVASRLIGDQVRGDRRWHFEAANGSLPFLAVNETAVRRLQAGEYAIVRDPAVRWPRYVLVPRDVAEALRSVDAAAVRYLA